MKSITEIELRLGNMKETKEVQEDCMCKKGSDLYLLDYLFLEHCNGFISALEWILDKESSDDKRDS